MSIKRTIITTVVGLTLVALVAPGVAQGVTIAELQAQINALLVQLQTLQGGVTTPSGNVPAVCAGVTFTRNLTKGSTGSDVKCLQAVLNQSAATQVAVTGAGSPGNETTTFGGLTLAAVRAYQTANGITPASQVGPLTRAKLNAVLGGTIVVTPGQPPVVVPTGAGLTVQLASDNPVSGTLVSGSNATDAQGGADIAHFTFVNGDNAEVKVTGLSLKRAGVSVDALLNNVYLYEGVNRLTDGASVSSGIINFNDSTGLFAVPAGGSKTIRVLIDTVYNKSGQTVGVILVAATGVTSNASSVKGTFPVSGNLFTTASAELATVAFAISTTPSTASVDPQNDYTIWQNIPQIGTRAVTLKRFAIRQTGSALTADIQNFRLYIDGVQAGSAVANADSKGYVTFDLSAAPVKIETGARTVKVLADIVGGSSKTFIYSLRASADASFTDTQVAGVDLVPTGNASSTTGAFAQRITGTMTINSGSVTFTKNTDSPSGTVVLSAPNAVLARYTLKAAGEPVKITDLYVGVVVSTAAVANVRNGALYANGVQIGSTATITEGDTTTGTRFSLGSSLIVNPLSPVTLEIRSDIKENSGTAIAAADTISATIITGSSNAEGTVSKTTISAPSANKDGNTLTVKTGSLTLAKYVAYTNQTPVPPVNQYKIGHFTVSNDTVESVNINTIQVNLSDVVSSYATSLYGMFGTDTLTTKPTISAYQNSWSVNYSLTPGQTKDLTFFADMNSSSSGTGTVGAYVSGTTASSAAAVIAGSLTSTTSGQSIVFSTGSLTPAFASTPLAGNVVGNQSVLAGRFKITAANDNYTVTEVKIKEDLANFAGATASINSATLKDIDGTVIKTTSGSDATKPFDTTITGANDTAYFTGLAIAVPKDTTKYFDVWLNLAVPSATASTAYNNVAVILDYVKHMNSQGTIRYSNSAGNSSTNSALNALNKAGNVQVVYHSVPTFTVLDLPATTVAQGAQATIYKFAVAADAKGPIAWKQLGFPVIVTEGGATSNPSVSNFKFFRTSGTSTTDITSSVNITNASGTDITGSTSISSGTGSTTFYIRWKTTTEETIPSGSSYTYSIKATANNFSNSTSGNDSVSVNLGSDTATTNYAGTVQHYIYNSSTSSNLVELTATYNSANAITSNVIWSDVSATGVDANSAAVGHDATATASSADWVNGYLVQNLPLDVKAVTGQ